MNFHCDCSNDDGDRPVVYHQVTRKARKAYRCNECGDPINRGDQYEHFSGLYDDHWSTYRTCQTCVRIRDDYCPGGYLFGELYDTLRECLGFEVVDPDYYGDDDDA